jgi:hypothetical protein
METSNVPCRRFSVLYQQKHANSEFSEEKVQNDKSLALYKSQNKINPWVVRVEIGLCHGTYSHT